MLSTVKLMILVPETGSQGWVSGEGPTSSLLKVSQHCETGGRVGIKQPFLILDQKLFG